GVGASALVPQIFTRNQVASGVTPPLGVAYLAAYLLAHDRPVQVIDALGEAPDQVADFEGETLLRGLAVDQIVDRIDPDVGLIGISNLFSFAYPAVEVLCRRLRRDLPRTPIVLGGHHPSAQWREILASLPEVSFVARGEEGEETLLGLVRHLEAEVGLGELTGLAHRGPDGTPVEAGATKRLVNLEQRVRLVAPRPGAPARPEPAAPFPARHLLPMENYIKAQEGHGPSTGRWTSILSSRGCPYACTFCSSRRTKWVARSAADVVPEMEHCIERWGIEEFHFEDDNMTIDQDRLVDICDEIIDRRLDVRWQTPNGIRASRTSRTMLEKMQRSGCTHVTLAPESGSERVLTDIVEKGRDFSLDQLEACGRDAHDVGLKVAAYFIIGLPGETVEDIEATIAYARRLARAGVDEVAFGLFVPLPGTPLWDRVVDRLGPVDWLDLLVVDDLNRAKSWNPHISDDELHRLRRRAYLTFHLTRLRHHPRAFARTVRNVLRDVEETKTERSLRQLLQRWNLRQKRYVPGPVDAPAADDRHAYPYDGARSLSVLLQREGHYAYGHSLRKAARLVAEDARRRWVSASERVRRRARARR
ncbi:MAG: radical SAM protein, partial [Actinomycetota bacterium]